MAGNLPPFVSKLLAPAGYKNAVIAAFKLDCRSVLVSLFLLAVVFSWTRIVKMSPTLVARLSANIGLEISSRQSDCAGACIKGNTASTVAAIKQAGFGVRIFLQHDKDGLFIEHFAADFAAGNGVAGADDLAGRAVFKHLDLQGDGKRAVLKQRLGDLATMDNVAR